MRLGGKQGASSVVLILCESVGHGFSVAPQIRKCNGAIDPGIVEILLQLAIFRHEHTLGGIRQRAARGGYDVPAVGEDCEQPRLFCGHGKQQQYTQLVVLGKNMGRTEEGRPMRKLC